MSENQQPLITHLLELRRRLLKAVGAIALLFLLLISFANQIYHLLAPRCWPPCPRGRR